MAKGPGWYPDPWAGEGLRWWDGSSWTEHVQGEPPPGYQPGVVMAGGPLVQGGGQVAWYHRWWFILLMLFLCCWPLGLVLTWTKPNTPTSIKLLATVGWFVLSAMIGAATYALFPDVYGARTTP